MLGEVNNGMDMTKMNGERQVDIMYLPKEDLVDAS